MRKTNILGMLIYIARFILFILTSTIFMYKNINNSRIYRVSFRVAYLITTSRWMTSTHRSYRRCRRDDKNHESVELKKYSELRTKKAHHNIYCIVDARHFDDNHRCYSRVNNESCDYVRDRLGG